MMYAPSSSSRQDAKKNGKRSASEIFGSEIFGRNTQKKNRKEGKEGNGELVRDNFDCQLHHFIDKEKIEQDYKSEETQDKIYEIYNIIEDQRAAGLTFEEIALENNLTILGASDIHGIADWLFEIPEGGHRPLTYILSKDLNHNSIKQALFKGNTFIWFEDIIAGKVDSTGEWAKAVKKVKDDNPKS